MRVGILLMAGIGERFLSGLPKQFHRLAGKRVYQYALETFLKISFDQILLVCHPEWICRVQEEIACYKDQRVCVVKGGTTRQESSFLGLKACLPMTSYVVIHDAVRPFVSEEILHKNLEGAVLFKAVDTCIVSHDTLVHVEGDQIKEIPKRSAYLRGQTPQSFAYPLIYQAHAQTKEKASTDDCRLVLELGKPVHVVEGDLANLKLTTPLDLILAEQILRSHHAQGVSSTKSLTHKKYAVVGGSRGIGKAVLDALKKEGAEVVDVSRTSLDYPLDITSQQEVQNTFEKIGEIDGLINSAGCFIQRPFHDLREEEMEKLIGTNFLGVLYACKWAKLAQGGHIVTIASSSYLHGKKNYALYSASKAAIVNFSEGLAQEREDLHIHVVIPQRTNTLLRQQHFPGDLLEELLTPEEVAHEVLSCLKQEGASGKVVPIRKSYAMLL